MDYLADSLGDEMKKDEKISKISCRIKGVFFFLYVLLLVLMLLLTYIQTTLGKSETDKLIDSLISTIINILFVLVPIVFTYAAEKTLDYYLLKNKLINHKRVEVVQVIFKFEMSLLAIIAVLFYLVIISIRVGLIPINFWSVYFCFSVIVCCIINFYFFNKINSADH